MKMNILPWLTLALLAAPLARSTHAAPGDLDPLDARIVGEYVLATAAQADGKTIVGGKFTSVLGVPRQNIARLNVDGTLDASFDPQANGTVLSVAAQPDGTILLGGSFTSLQPNGAAAPTSRLRLARLNADGALAPGFSPEVDSTVFDIAVQADGKVLLAGIFNTLKAHGAAAPIPRPFIARVNADGTLDAGFDPNPNSYIVSVELQANGRVLLGGFFTTLQPNGAVTPIARQFLARVNEDGTLDAGFDPKTNDAVRSVAVQADGKVLLGGTFTTLQPNGAASPIPRQFIARVNEDGTLDMGFDPKANDYVLSTAVQANGKVLLGGTFTTLQPNGALAPAARQRIGRVNADGSLDTSFDPKASGAVYSVAMQADGRVFLGGSFTSLQPNGAPTVTLRNLFARTENDPPTQTLAASGPTTIVWQRGGGAPELSRATFDLSTNAGASWTTLGTATRQGTTANWQRTGLALPASGLLRARGASAGGYSGGSLGVIEQVSAFTSTLTPIQQWKLAKLGDANAPDLGDTDFDGLVHLAEYALNMSPTAFTPPPIVTRFTYPEGDRLRVSFTRDPTSNDVTLEVQSAANPAGPWTTVATSALGGVTTGSGYVGGDNATPGLKIVEVRDTVNISPATPSRYLRVKVTH